jgi:hypothetical protein
MVVVIVVATWAYQDLPEDPYAIAAIAVHETCHINQIWNLKLWYGWTAETECTLKEIDAMKQIGAPQ